MPIRYNTRMTELHGFDAGRVVVMLWKSDVRAHRRRPWRVGAVGDRGIRSIESFRTMTRAKEVAESRHTHRPLTWKRVIA